jgi:hypothetical protein
LDVLSRAGGKGLLSPRLEQAAQEYAALFTQNRKELPLELDGTLELKTEIIHLAIEAYRRELIANDRLAEIGQLLHLTDLPKTKLLGLAQAAR